MIREPTCGVALQVQLLIITPTRASRSKAPLAAGVGSSRRYVSAMSY
jgi:hypothetical protein